MKKRNKGGLAAAVLIPLTTGILSALFSGGMAQYGPLNKPALSPPGFVFPLVWFVLYLLMGISSYIIYRSRHPEREAALALYGIQLLVNFFWSILFFRFSLYLPAFLWLILLIALITAMIRRFCRIRPAAGYLQIPYLLWCLFAAYLNFMVYRLN